MNEHDKTLQSNRREFIKTSLCALGAGAIALSGCNKKEVKKASLNNESIVPKQTGIYEFSCPLPYNYKGIDEILKLNTTIKKSKVVNVFNSAPLPLTDKYNRFIHLTRGKNTDITSYNDVIKYAKYAQDNGLNFIYLMNSPKVFVEKEYKTFESDFLYLLDLLKKNNIRNIKVANMQVCRLINMHAPNDFNLSASTAFEFQHILQYKYLFDAFPNFNFVDIANDENQNFQLLKSLRETFPNIKLEVMVNESCIKGCPARKLHVYGGGYSLYTCLYAIQPQGFFPFLMKTGVLYPWVLEYYSSIGINNFKYVQNTHYGRANYKIDELKRYLTYVEGGVENVDLLEFLLANFNNDFERMVDKKMGLPDKKINVKLSDLKNCLPDIRYFIKHGHDCHTRCGVECHYCDECAKKIEKLIYS